MKYVKMLGLLAVAAAAMMAFAASASAVSTTAPAGTQHKGTIHSTSEGKVSLTNSSGDFKISCHSTVHGNSVSTTKDGTTAGSIVTLTYKNCEGGTVHNGETGVKGGELIVHSLGGGKGTLTSTGAEVTTTVSTIFGTIACTYTTNATDIGTLTGASSSTGHAKLAISANLPRTGGSSLCGSTGIWSGTYKVESPTGLTIT